MCASKVLCLLWLRDTFVKADGSGFHPQLVSFALCCTSPFILVCQLLSCPASHLSFSCAHLILATIDRIDVRFLLSELRKCPQESYPHGSWPTREGVMALRQLSQAGCAAPAGPVCYVCECQSCSSVLSFSDSAVLFLELAYYPRFLEGRALDRSAFAV